MRSDEVRAAVDLNLSGLRFDAMKQAQIMLRKDGDLKMKKKLSVSMAIALALLLVTVAAVAAVLLSGKDVVDQVIAPKAMENQDEMFTQAEVDEILAFANKQGITLEPRLMQMLSRREGYYKSELAMLFAKEALGFYPGTWDVADQHWFGEFRVKIGSIGINYATVPQEGEKSQEEIEAIAKAYIREKAGKDFPLDDRTRYDLYRSFTATKINPHRTIREWGIGFEPLSQRDPGFQVKLTPQGEVKGYQDTVAFVTQELPKAGADTQVNLMVNDFLRIHSMGYLDLLGLTQENLQELRVLLKPWENDETALESYYGFLLKQQFGPAPEGSLSREQAIEVAVKAAQEQFKVTEQELRQGPARYQSSRPYIYAVLLKAEGDYRWKVSFAKDYLVELDARTGKVELMDVYSPGNSENRRFTLDSLLPEEQRAYASPRPDFGTWVPNLPATPYPQPVGFKAPQLYWDTLQKIGYKAETASLIWDEMYRDYGEDTRFWPQEKQALYAFRFDSPDAEGQAIVGIPLPEDISAQKAVEAAKAGLAEGSQALYAKDYLAGLTPTTTYYYNMPGEGRRAWRVSFLDVSGEQALEIAYATVDALTGELLPESREPRPEQEPEQQFTFGKAPMGEDGRPLLWGHKSIPQYYWDMMEQRKDTYESALKLVQEELKRTGQYGVGWSMEVNAVHDLWINEHLSENEHGLLLSGLPAPTDIQPDKALELAWAAFKKDAGDKYSDEVMARLQPMIGFSFNYFGPDTRHYHVEFVDPAQPGYVTLGMVDLDAVSGEIRGTHSDAGNG